MKSFAVASLFATLAVAQSASSSNSTSSSNPLIPANISTSCSTFFNQLNDNDSLSACLAPLINATSQFSAGSNATQISSSTITSALGAICSSSSQCDVTLVRTQLTSFYQACGPELTSAKNDDVLRSYDVLYLLPALQQAVCQKDDSGDYCLNNITTSSSAPSGKRAVFRRADGSQVALIPDVAQYSKENIAFLGLQANLTSDQLCNRCTANIMNVYTTQLNAVPYAPGIQNSALLAGQPTLYDAVNSKCGAALLGGPVQAAGGLATGAAPRAADGSLALLGSALAAVAAGAIAVL
ncbi:hypothetical protein BC834DRAFT_828509 [Gloeopeniophorella convolvens]|nr:hypothetical protein BC834DRAFT_828509 [Gloeopeniophorella convolvens]